MTRAPAPPSQPAGPDPLDRGRDEPLVAARAAAARRSRSGRWARVERAASVSLRAARRGGRRDPVAKLLRRSPPAPTISVQASGSTRPAAAQQRELRQDHQGGRQRGPLVARRRRPASKAKPPVQTGPAPAGRPSGSAAIARRGAARAQSVGDLAGSGPDRAQTTSPRCPAPRARSRRGRAAPSRTSGRRRAARRARRRDRVERRRSRPWRWRGCACRCRGACVERPIEPHPGACPCSSSTLTNRPTRRASRGRSRPRPCAPSRSGRAGGSCARRPRSCRRCRSPRWSASGGRRRRSWRGRSRRTA